VLMVSPANARRTSSIMPVRSAISSCNTLYSGGGSEPNIARNARLVTSECPSAR
jgi:hypothetical protein